MKVKKQREGRRTRRGEGSVSGTLGVRRVGGPITLQFRAHEQHVQAASNKTLSFKAEAKPVLSSGPPRF